MRWPVINRLTAFFMMGLLVFIGVKRYVFDNDKLNANHRFTVATVYKLSYPVEGGPDADFEYCVNKKKYTGYTAFNPNEGKISVGEKFLLKYYPPDPAISQILLDQPLDSATKPDVVLDICQVNPD